MTRTGWILVAATIAAMSGSVLAWQPAPATGSPATGSPATGSPGTGSSSVAGAFSIDGAMLFRAKGCATCHAGPDSPAALGMGLPSLADASSWAGTRNPDLTAAEYLSESIREPSAFISPEVSDRADGPGVGMPDLELSDTEVAAIVEYLLAG